MKGKVMEAMERARKPMDIDEIMKLSRLNSREVERALQELERARLVRKDSRDRWELR